MEIVNSSDRDVNRGVSDKFDIVKRFGVDTDVSATLGSGIGVGI